MPRIEILLIQNNSSDIKLIKESLSGLKDSFGFLYGLSCVSTLKEGLSVLRERRFDVLLFDPDLPDSKGIESCKKVLGAGDYAPATIVLSDMEDPQVEIKLFQMGVYDYLHKEHLKPKQLYRSIILSMERAKLRASLENERQNLLNMIDTSVDGMIIIDDEGMIKFVNPMAEKLFNHKKEELIGYPFGIPVVSKEFAELEIPAKDGSLRNIEMHLTEMEWDEKRATLATLRDVSEQKKSEKNLQQKQNYLQALFDTDPNILITTDGKEIAHGSIKLLEFTGFESIEAFKKRHKCICNLFEDIPGYMQPEMEGESWLEHIHAHPQTLHKAVVKKEGREHIFMIKANRLIGDEKNRSIVVLSDITELENAITELKEQKERSELYLETAQTMLLALDKEGKIALINPRGCEILGYSQDELIGKNWFEHCIAKESLKEIKEVFTKIITNKKRWSRERESEIVKKNGARRLIRWRNAQLIDASGKIIGTLSSGDDVTAKRKDEEELRRYAQIISSSEDMFVLIDSGYRYMAASPNYIEAFGKKQSEVIGHTVAEVAGEKFFHTIVKPNMDLCLKGKSVRFELNSPFNKGGSRILEARYFPYRDKKGAVSGIVANLRDITESKKIQEELKEKEKMMISQSRQAAMGDMIAMIAHQWRQPLTVISMAVNNLELAMFLEKEITNEMLTQTVKTVTKQTQHLSKTIDDFRNFFMPNKEKVKTTLCKVLEDTMSLIGKSLENNDIKVEYDCPAEHPSLYTYPNELIQVLLNIIGNAKDAIKENHPIKNSLNT